MSGDSLPRLAGCTMMVKATRLCNLRCSYCRDWRTGSGQTMSLEILARMTKLALADRQLRAIDFAWHGGEPALLPLDFYKRALHLQERYREPWQRILNGIQTNATTLTPAWAGFLREHRFRVGVSLDVASHDQARVDSKGRGSLSRVLAGMDLLRAERVPFSVLTVVTPQLAERGPDALLDFLFSHQIGSVGLIRLRGDRSASLATDWYERFLVRLFDAWLPVADRLRVREFDGLLTELRGENSGQCTLSGRCFGYFFMVEPNGEIAHCDLFLDDERYVVGSVFDRSLAAIRQGEKLQALAAEAAAQRRRMMDCPNFAVCSGGCPHRQYERSGLDAATTSCCGQSQLIDHLRDRGEVATATADGYG